MDPDPDSAAPNKYGSERIQIRKTGKRAGKGEKGGCGKAPIPPIHKHTHNCTIRNELWKDDFALVS